MPNSRRHFLGYDESLAVPNIAIDRSPNGTFQDRNVARAAMILSAFADPRRSPVSSRLIGDIATTDTVNGDP